MAARAVTARSRQDHTMLRDAFLPATLAHSREPVFRAVEKPGIRYSAARWTPDGLGRVVASLREGEEALRAIPAEALLAAWSETVATFLRSGSLGGRGGGGGGRGQGG